MAAHESLEKSTTSLWFTACNKAAAKGASFMNNRVIAIIVLSTILLTVSMGQSQPSADSVQHSFASGGTIHLKLSSGDYTIRAGAEDRILARWASDETVPIEDVVRLAVRGASATVRTDGPLKHSRFVIELPGRSDIQLNIRAGDIRIAGIEGNKEIHMTAGDLNISLDPDLYSRIDASTTFGDLDAYPLHISKGGIARSFHWTGSGKYALSAHLFAGDLKLYRHD
jgi:hypothetical protein